MSDEIADFVGKIRDNMDRGGAHNAGQMRDETTTRRRDRPHDDERDITAAQSAIIQSERFKATVEKPKGMREQNDDLNVNLKELIQLLKEKTFSEGDNDDDFMHVTCHIDNALRSKIGRGEFVELDKLLPKTRTQVMNSSDDDAIQLIRKDGSKFLVPRGSGREQKITNIRKWEQAFRVYAAIYSEINPQRSSEIWQYVHIINTASQSYSWENVSFYDFTFRQLMERKPNRSWAKIYTQMWNLALTDHISKGGNNYNKPNPGAVSNSKTGDWRDRCCWRFNKGKCTKWNCRFEHCCSVKDCGAYSHEASQCNKKKKGRAPPAVKTSSHHSPKK